MLRSGADIRSVLQILDDGRVTDSQGRTVSFKNTILIMTSNLGSQAILEGMASGAREAVKDTVMSMVRPCHYTQPASIRNSDRNVILVKLQMWQYARNNLCCMCIHIERERHVVTV